MYEPPRPFHEDPQWAHITGWREEPAPCYDQAKRMPGVTGYPGAARADRVLRELGIEHTARPTPVGVVFATGDRKPGQEVI